MGRKKGSKNKKNNIPENTVIEKPKNISTIKTTKKTKKEKAPRIEEKIDQETLLKEFDENSKMYQVPEHSEVLGHILLINNKVASARYKHKKMYGVFFNTEYVGILEKFNDSDEWIAKMKMIRFQQRKCTVKKSKNISSVLTHMVESYLDDVIKKKEKKEEKDV